jgi:hypothetical protein
MGGNAVCLAKRPRRHPPGWIGGEVAVLVVRDRVSVRRDQQAGEEPGRQDARRHLRGDTHPARFRQRRGQPEKEAGERRHRGYPKEPLEWRANPEDRGRGLSDMGSKRYGRADGRTGDDQRRHPVANEPGSEPHREPTDHGNRPGVEEQRVGVEGRGVEPELEPGRRRVPGADVAGEQRDGGNCREERQRARAALEQQRHRGREQNQRHDERGARRQADTRHRRDRGKRRRRTITAPHPSGEIDEQGRDEPGDEERLALREARDEVAAEREPVGAVQEQERKPGSETDQRTARRPGSHEPPERPDREHGEDRRQRVVGDRARGRTEQPRQRALKRGERLGGRAAANRRVLLV